MKNRRALLVTAVLLVVGILVDVVTGADSAFPGYAASIGLFGCIVIIIGSKWLGKLFIQAPEDYYPQDTPPDHVEDLRG